MGWAKEDFFQCSNTHRRRTKNYIQVEEEELTTIEQTEMQKKNI